MRMAMTREELAKAKTRHYIYKCPCKKWHRRVKRKAGRVIQYTQQQIAEYIKRGGLTGA